MKRILVETLCAMAVLVFLASLHGRVSSLKENGKEVAELRDLARSTAENLGAFQKNHDERLAAIERMEMRIAHLTDQVAQTDLSQSETNRLKAELTETRRETERFRAELSLDLSRTRATVDAYQDEMRTCRKADSAFLRETRNDVAILANHIRRDPRTLTEELLSPAVQLNGDDTVGSGTLIFSGKNPKAKKVETYVVTSYHVVRNILADTPRARRDGISVTIYHQSRAIPKEELRCDMVSHDSKIDAALLKLRSNRKFTNIARVISKEDSERIRVWDPIYAVGCPLGNDPIPSQGEVSSLNNELNGANYWMINAPTYFGNSGGGVYLAESRELAGVFSKIYTHGRGTPIVIPHMGLFTPMPAIFAWLQKEKMAFVLNNSTLSKRKVPNVSLEHIAAPAPR